MLRSLHHKGLEWKCSFLGEGALLIEPKKCDNSLAFIHEFCRMLESANIKGVEDVVPAYLSIAIHFDSSITRHDSLIDTIGALASDQQSIQEPKTIQIPVCYELGMDWTELEAHTGLNREQIIEKHTNGFYTVAMLGFLPGFIFLDGLDPDLSCPRKESPRKKIPAGSVGIGGDQAGLYSLESPGGWNVIGRTPDTFFDVRNDPPVAINPGDKVQFNRISEAKFEERVTGNA